MGNEKKKRKSAGALPAQPAKERRLEEDYPSWRDHSGYTVLQLLDSQSVMFVGEATLQVLHGAVRVMGKLVTVESPPLVLSTGGRFSLAISIAAEAHATQVPFSASQQVVELSLQSRPLMQPPARTGPPAAAHPQHPQQHPQQQQQQQAAPGQAQAASPCTFALHRPSDPRAPASMTVSRDWAQAVDDVCAAAASGAPVVLAVLGAKGMGKSSLARLITNRLLDLAQQQEPDPMGAGTGGGSGGGSGSGGGWPAVAFLDTDVGQPEFTPPGLLSLHLLGPGSPLVGPPHAHSRQPWAARFVGDVSPQHDPQLYLSAAQALYGTYWNWAQGLAAIGCPWPPLVVNTHGWVKGLGFDLLTQLLRLVAPTHVIQIRGGSEKKNLPRGAFWCDPRDAQAAAAAAPAVLITLDTLVDANTQAAAAPGGGGSGGGQDAGGGRPCSSDGGGGASAERDLGPGRPRGGGGGGGAPLTVTLRSLKPVDCRGLAWHAWAKRVVGSEPAWGSYESDDFWRNAGALASLPPWHISLDLLHVHLLAGSLPHQQLGRLLNGAVVGLLATTAPPPPAAAAASAAASAAWWGLDEAAAAAAYPPGRVSYIGASAAPPPLLPCVGLGIVRAVDMTNRTAYVLTDVDGDVLECVGALVVGRLELPGSLVVGGEVAWPYQQLFGLSAEATGAGAGKARKNLSRSSLVELAG
ncbi:hypothetical protein PLESTF_000068700 [Pleodorina starrii]|nr:hypothetical protein PLESTF_000068700 [Pleodorina starrii]